MPSRIGSYTSPTPTTTDPARQRCPADPNTDPTTASATISGSASGSTIMWFLAPPSACTRFPAAPARAYTIFATRLDPTNDTPATSGWSISASTASCRPCTTFSTPGGSPARTASSTTRWCVSGSCSLGLSTTVFPAATAYGQNHIGIITGKLYGVITAKTPMGCRTVSQSTPRAMSSRVSPIIRVGIAAACSTFSIPRCTSPHVSATFLPCSRERLAARSSWCSSSSALRRKKTRARSGTGVRRQAGKAARAAWTARSTSAGPETGMEPRVSPVAGSVTGSISQASRCDHSPAM